MQNQLQSVCFFHTDTLVQTGRKAVTKGQNFDPENLACALPKAGCVYMFDSKFLRQ